MSPNHRVHCCCNCKIFDHNVDDLAEFNAGIIYSGGANFDGVLGPGESIEVLTPLDGRANKSFYRVFADAQQPPGVGQPIKYEWEGFEVGNNVAVFILVDGLPSSSYWQYNLTIEFSSVNWGGTECISEFPPGFATEYRWRYGDLSGSGDNTYVANGLFTPDLIGNGNWRWLFNTSGPETITVTKVTLEFPDVLSDPESPEHPMEFTMQARNGQGIGWTLLHERSEPSGPSGRKICGPLDVEEGDQDTDGVYERRQLTQGQFFFDSSEGYVQRGYMQVDYIEEDSDYRHWVGDSAWYKDGGSVAYYNDGDLTNPVMVERDGFPWSPVADVRSWEYEIGPEFSIERTLEFAPVGNSGESFATSMPKGPMEDLVVTFTNDGDGDIHLFGISAYLTQGADPIDAYACPSTDPQPDYPAINASCDRWKPPCDGFSDLRQLRWDVENPIPATSQEYDFADYRTRGLQVCGPSASSSCYEDDLDAGIPTSVLFYASDWTPAPELKNPQIQPISSDVTQTFRCDQAFPTPVWTKRTTEEGEAYDWRIHNEDLLLASGSPAQIIDWDFRFILSRVPGEAKATGQPQLTIYYAETVAIDASGPGVYTVKSQPYLETERFDPVGDPDPVTGLYEEPGQFSNEMVLPGDVYGEMKEPKTYVHLWPFEEIDLCDLVPGYTRNFDVTGAPTIFLASGWQIFRRFGSPAPVATNVFVEETDDMSDCPDDQSQTINGYDVNEGFYQAFPFYVADPNSTQNDINGTRITVTLKEWRA